MQNSPYREPPDEVAAVFGTHSSVLPTPKQQNLGAMLSIVIIVLMIVIGAFYAWGKRTAEQQVYPTTAENALPANY